MLIVRPLNYPFRVAFAIAIALAQIGEFSFILSNIGRELGILTREATNSYATFFYAQLDLRRRRLLYVNAGHNPPYLVRQDETGAELTRLTFDAITMALAWSPTRRRVIVGDACGHVHVVELT